MKKNIAIIAAISIFAETLAGCGTAGNAPSVPATTPAASASAETTAVQAETTTAQAETTAAQAETTAAAETEKQPVMTAKELPRYYGSTADKDTMTVYFEDNRTDIPFIDLETGAKLLNYVGKQYGDDKMNFTVSDSGGVVTLKRENGSRAEIDFNKKEVLYYDMDELFRFSYLKTVLDVAYHTGLDSNGKPAYISREGTTDFQRKGAQIGVLLNKHNIPVCYQDKKGYVPLQTFADLLLSSFEITALYNGKALFFLHDNEMNDLKDLYYAAPAGKRSKELAQFSYDELSLVLDMFYGLKDSHNIGTFEDFFEDTGLDKKLLSEDPQVADKAVFELTQSYFADFHSGYLGNSFYTGQDAETGSKELVSNSYMDFVQKVMTYQKARKAAYPDGTPSYEEIGDTAYVTFDEFTLPDFKTTDYYVTKATPGSADTIGLVMYAHSRIMRKGSPVRNVVLDLSTNGGGDQYAAIYTIGWFLGNCTLNLKNTLTDSMASTQYRIDVNGDRVFDEKDSISSKNLFCLISPNSFSCGNMLPAVFKQSGNVTLIGRKSGGGSCVVFPLTAADGTMFQISGNKRISTVINGAFYDVDQGVEPDFPLTKADSFFERKSLTKYIDSLH